MAETFLPLQLVTFTNDISAVNAVNANFTAIANLFTDVLSRSGGSPNQMTTSLDMNGHNIINLAVPQSPTSPVRLIDILAPGSSFTIPPTGTSGAVVGFLNGNNTYSGTSTFTAAVLTTNTVTNTFGPTSLGAYSNAFQWSATGTGNPQSTSQFAQFIFTDNGIASGVNQVSAIQHFMTLSSNLISGTRAACSNELNMTAASSPANTARNYFGTQTLAQANTADNGTGLTTSTAAGNMFGLFTQSELLTGAINWFQVCGQATRIAIDASSSALAKSAIQIGSTVSDRTSGTSVDSMIWMVNQNGSNPGWTTGILFDGSSGIGFWPMKTTGTFIKATGGATVSSGIDFSGVVFTQSAFLSPNFAINGSTGLTSIGGAGSNGQLNLLNSAGSSFASLAVDTTGTILTLSCSSLKSLGSFATNTPTTVVAASYTVLQTDISLIINTAGACTLTLPTPSTNAGRWLYIKVIVNQNLVSASSNVVAFLGGAAGTSMLTGSASGRWATFQCDGTNWINMAGDTP